MEDHLYTGVRMDLDLRISNVGDELTAFLLWMCLPVQSGETWAYSCEEEGLISTGRPLKAQPVGRITECCVVSAWWVFRMNWLHILFLKLLLWHTGCIIHRQASRQDNRKEIDVPQTVRAPALLQHYMLSECRGFKEAESDDFNILYCTAQSPRQVNSSNCCWL